MLSNLRFNFNVFISNLDVREKAALNIRLDLQNTPVFLVLIILARLSPVIFPSVQPASVSVLLRSSERNGAQRGSRTMSQQSAREPPGIIQSTAVIKGEVCHFCASSIIKWNCWNNDCLWTGFSNAPLVILIAPRCLYV